MQMYVIVIKVVYLAGEKMSAMLQDKYNFVVYAQIIYLIIIILKLFSWKIKCPFTYSVLERYP